MGRLRRIEIQSGIGFLSVTAAAWGMACTATSAPSRSVVMTDQATPQAVILVTGVT